ncbi:MAG: hypothetical protein V3T76_02110, partial [candidate division NC10 bacterium]
TTQLISVTVNDVDESAAAPPQVFEVRVVRGSDDAEERADGSIRRGNKDLELVEDRAEAQTVGIRFEGTGIPQGAVITGAYIQFQVDEFSTEPADLTIHGQASDDAASFARSKGDISGRETTAASAGWQPAGWDTVGAAGVDQRTADISEIVQEIVDRGGWDPDNGLAFIITGSGKRVAESFNGDASGAPLLHVEYQMPGSGGTGPTDVQVSADVVDEGAAVENGPVLANDDDVFEYTGADTDGNDTILDFGDGTDTVDLDALFDALGAGDAEARADLVDIDSTTTIGKSVLAVNDPNAGDFSITFAGGLPGAPDGAPGFFDAAALAALGIDVGDHV